LYPDECPKTVENFCTHAKNNYYNGAALVLVCRGLVSVAACFSSEGHRDCACRGLVSVAACFSSEGHRDCACRGLVSVASCFSSEGHRDCACRGLVSVAACFSSEGHRGGALVQRDTPACCMPQRFS
jgi:cyclophilin family peptidyl-prolyl cis-trans isomerase